MLFNSFLFIVIFPAIFAAYYLCPAKARNFLLLLISYLLYMNWQPVYALILLYVTLVTFLFALKLPDNGRRKPFLAAGVLLSVLPLLFFKYYNFINKSVFAALAALGLRFELPALDWALPVGISFFTFQALGYLADVYWKNIDKETGFLDYALFISFFPQVAAGPISKAQDFLPQIKNLRPFNEAQAVEGLKMLLWGMFLKVVLADRLALYVDAVYRNYQYQSGLSCLAASIAYSIQIYADFAGYSLMAIGVARVLGFNLINNFNRPYFSVSVTDFWRRWHISLSRWLRDYIFIPLGGSRCSKGRNYWNIFVTFLVSGIWHGANWTFIVWGMLHGVFQIIEKIFGLQKSAPKGFPRALRILMTFLLVNFAWIFFRLPTLTDGCSVVYKIFTDFTPELYLPGTKSTTLFIVSGLLILFFKDIRDEFFPEHFVFFENRNRIVRWATYMFILIVIMTIGVFDAGQFIYVNF